MTKIIRRHIWLISAFFKRYYLIIISSLVVSIVLVLMLGKYLTRATTLPPQIRIGIVGQYSSQLLPPLVKNILNSGFTTINESQEVVPNLAHSWEIKEDGLSYLFHLKPNLTWSDNSKINVKDIDLNIPNVSIETISESDLLFKLPEKFSPFPSLLTNPLINKNGQTSSQYQVKLSQNSNGVMTKAELDKSDQKIIIRIFPNTTAALNAYKLGEIDAVYGLSDQIGLEKFGKLINVDASSQAVALFFNTADPILKDKSIRQGIAYLLQDKGFDLTRATGPISRLSWAYNPLVKLYDYDKTKAEKLIKDSNPNKNTAITLELATLPQNLNYAEQIKSQIDPSLIALNIKVVTVRPDSFQLFLSTFEMPPDPDQYVYWHSTQSTNVSHFKNDKIDKALEDGRRVVDQNERRKIYNDFQRTFAEELPALFLFYPKYQFLSRSQAILDTIDPRQAL